MYGCMCIYCELFLPLVPPEDTDQEGNNSYDNDACKWHADIHTQFIAASCLASYLAYLDWTEGGPFLSLKFNLILFNTIILYHDMYNYTDRWYYTAHFIHTIYIIYLYDLYSHRLW